MNPTTTFELAGRLVHLDEAAHRRLLAYLNALRRALDGTEGAEEILADVEVRLVELFDERLAGQREVVNVADVEWAEGRLGQPEDFVDEDQAAPRTVRKLFRDRENGMIGGIASGLGAYLNIEPTWARLAFLALLTVGFAIPLYLILWIIIPQAKSRTDRLAMHGDEPTIENIKRRVSEELSGMSNRVKSSRFREAVQDVVAFLERVFRLVFKVFGRFVGAALVLLSLALLLSVVGLLTGIGGVSWGRLGFHAGDQLLALAQSTLPAGFGMPYAWIALALTCALPLAFVASAVAWMLSPSLRRGARIGWVLAASAVVTLMGVAMGAGLGMRLGMEFSREGTVMHRLELPAVDGPRVLQLAALDSLVSWAPVRWEGTDLSWVVGGGRIWMDDVEVDVRWARDGVARLDWTAEAHGANRRAARARAQRMDFKVVAEGNAVAFSDGFAFPLDDRYRGQNVRITLHLPEGEEVWLDPSLEDWIDDAPHVDGLWGRGLTGTTWTMTPEGLASPVSAEGSE